MDKWEEIKGLIEEYFPAPREALTRLVNALITKYFGEPTRWEWIDEFGEKCWTDSDHARPSDATPLYARKE